MARPTPQQTAALNILDWLHFNQSLVYAVFSDEHRLWLNKIFERVKVAVAATGKTGVEAEIMKHYVLCYLEILISDQHVPDWPDCPDGEIYEKVQRYNKIFFAGMLHAIVGARGYSSDVELSIAEKLCVDVQEAPVAVRFRLAERCLAFEYPNAARDALVWFAETQAFPCAKYRDGTIAHEQHATVVTRIGLLCEFELMRKSSMRERKAQGVAETLFANMAAALPSPFDKILVHQAGKLWTEKFYGVATPSNSVLSFLVDRAFDKDYVAQFLKYISTLWTRRRLCEGTAAAWVGIIGASNLVMAKLDDGTKPLYESTKNAGTISDEASKSLLCHGLSINARTLYLHYREFDQLIRPRIAVYYATLQSFERVIAADDEDIWYFILCVVSQ